MKTIFIIIFFVSSCNQNPDRKIEADANIDTNYRTNLFSKSVNDTFSIFVNLPGDYSLQNKIKYPVVYILDANLYFDIMSVIIKKYSEVGLLSRSILVGIGYKDFQTMDSLRSRDYTYPTAIPEYEMSVSGKGNNFLSFINNELIPHIENKYQVNKAKRILMGHSLGGYFTLYALQQNLSKTDSVFSGYIAASPSTHYNHNYLLNEFEKLNTHNNKPKVYVTFGGLEDTENAQDTTMIKSDKVFVSLSKSLTKNNINFLGEKYSNLDHMATSLPTFVKGLQWILNVE